MPPQGNQGNPGMSSPVQQAFARRAEGQQTPQLGQQSPQVPGGQQMPQPTPPSGIPQRQGSSTAPAQQQKFQPQDRRDLIVQALIEQMKIDNAAEKQAITMSQPAPQGGGLQDYVSQKVPTLMSEGKNQQQALGQAYGMGRDKGYGGHTNPMNQQTDYPYNRRYI